MYEGVDTMALDAKIETLKRKVEELIILVDELRATALALDAKIEILKKRFQHHIDLKDAHKEPIKG